MQYAAPAVGSFGNVQYGAPMQSYGAPVQTMAQPMQYAPQQQVRYAAPAQTLAAPTMRMAPAAAPIQAVQGPTIRTENPVGAEMLQVTVFGTKKPDQTATQSGQPLQVDIEIAGKPHKHTVETAEITGPAMVPKSLVTYYVPGEHLNFTVSQNGSPVGDVQISGEDFHPSGLEGDLPLMDPSTGSQGSYYLMVKIVPLGTSGQMADLEPVHIQAEPKQTVDPEPIVVGTGAMRACSPEEYEQMQAQGGRPMSMEEAAKLNVRPVAQPQPTYMQPQPQPMYAAQPQPMFAAQPQPMYAAQPQPMYGAQPQPMFAAQPQPTYAQPQRR